MKDIIFYFSGTGNSLWLAHALAKEIGNCELISIAQFDTNQTVYADRIGIVFPVYHWGTPNIIKRFISKVKIEGKPYIYSFHSMGGYDGIAALQIKEGLLERGCILNASFKAKLPQNYIVSTMFKVPKSSTVAKEFDKAESKVKEAAKWIKEQKTYVEKETFIHKLFHEKAIKVNREGAESYPTMDKNFVINTSCTSCAKCAHDCPVKNINMENGKPVFQHHCEFCLKCLHQCPKEAIDFKTITVGKKRYINPKIKDIISKLS